MAVDMQFTAILQTVISSKLDYLIMFVCMAELKLYNIIQYISHQSLRAIEEWPEKWLVNFNAKKTQLMTISRKRSKSINEDITFVNESLIEVENIKLLGINITSSLDLSYHINHLAKRVGQRLGILRKARKFFSPASILILYKTKVILQNYSKKC